MATVIDSYTQGGIDSNINMYPGASLRCGQSLTNTNSIKLDSCKFYIQRIGNPTGNVYAELYAHSGTYGTSSVPTGSPLATSDAIAVGDIGTGTFQEIVFTFSGANRITLDASTYYVLEIFFDYATANDSNKIAVGIETSSPSHSGNENYNISGFTAEAGNDMPFILWGVNVYSMPVTVGAFTLTGVTTGLLRGFTLVASAGSYLLTGINVNLLRPVRNMAVEVGTFALSGVDALFTLFTGTTWSFGKKNTSSHSEKVKNISTFSYPNKNTTSYTSNTKNTSEYTQVAKKTSSWTYPIEN